MVNQRPKSLVSGTWQRRELTEIFAFSTVICRPLPFAHLLCWLFWTQISDVVNRLERGKSV